MHTFLANHRDELVARCAQKVAQRPHRAATPAQLRNGIPLFLEQLRRTLEAEEDGQAGASVRISGPSGGDEAMSEMGVTATAHGKELLGLGFSVDQVVHDYGDLCQAITDLALVHDAPFGVDEFRTLNRCLDNAIADAVTGFSEGRDEKRAVQQAAEINERVGFLVHELRNALGTATLAVNALEMGNLPLSGATGSVLKRSLATLTKLVDHTLIEVRLNRTLTTRRDVFPVASFIQDASNAAALLASAKGCVLEVRAVLPGLIMSGNRELLSGALNNLLQNAIKFTRPRTLVTLNVTTAGDRVVIDVEDRCGGLPEGVQETIFTPFTQRSTDRSGLGLGLSISRQSVQADGGVLSVRNLPGCGCVFSISLPLHDAATEGPLPHQPSTAS